MRKDQKGFTLVELIIAVAILAIVTLAVCGFIVVGSRSYTSANTDIMLQQDAQLALNQISDVIIDTTDSISYGVRAGGVGDMQLVLKDSEFGGEATEKCLAVINKNEAGSTNDNESYWFYWSKDDETIYFNKVEAYSSTMSTSEIQSAFEAAADQTKVSILAQHVTDFSVDLTQFEANRVVMITATFENGNRVYSTSNNVTVRNRIALNELTVGPLKRAEEFTINTVSSVTLEPGDYYSLASKVTVTTPSSDQAITFEQVGGDQYGTSVDAAGMVRIGKEDMRENFSVKVSRTNEEYAGQNNRVAKTIRVNIKRATTVNISGPASAKQGETVDLTGSARGNMLGERCDQCIGDDLSKDWDVYDWQVISGDATIVTSDNGAATVKIGDKATVGVDIVIQAASVLSRDKNGGYGPEDHPTVAPVTGIWKIRVEKGTSGDFPLQGDFKFGTDNDPGILDYMRSKLKTDWYRYVICVRVREMGATNADDDLVVIYYSVGANERFVPDMFGLKLDRSYKVFFQVLDPVSKETRQAKADNKIDGYYEDSASAIVKEYFDNLDSDGKYVGTKYESDELYSGLLNPPRITLTLNGVSYPNNLIDFVEKYHMLSREETVLGQPSLGDIINVESNLISQNIRYTFYKGEGNNPANWTRIYGIDGSDSVLQNNQNQYTGNQSIGAISFNPTSSQFVKRDINNYDSVNSVGTYHIVPGYVYKNNPDPNNRNFEYLYQDPRVINGDWAWHYYEQPDSTITLVIDDGLNLLLRPEDEKKSGSDNGERWLSFPLPTDADFPFALKNSGKQTITKNFTIYSSDGKTIDQNNLSGYYQQLLWNDAVVTCEYVEGVNGSKDSYNITIALEKYNGKNVTTTSYGTYKCVVGGNEWVYIGGAKEEKTVTINTNLEITKDGVTYETYFPTPSESGLSFDGNEKTTGYTLLLFNKNGGNPKYEYVTVKYQLVGGSYRITFTTTNTVNRKKTTYTCGPLTYTGSGWGTGVYTQKVEALWDLNSLVTFTYNGQQCKIELDNPPQNSNYTVKPETYYYQSDEYGSNGQNPWGGMTIAYTYENGVYTAIIRNTYNDNDIYATCTYDTSSKKWTRIR